MASSQPSTQIQFLFLHNQQKLQVSKMEFGVQREGEQMRRMTEFENGKRSLPKPKPSIKLPFDVMVSILIRLPARHLRRMRSVCKSWSLLISDRHFVREYSKFRASVTKRPRIISLYHCYQWPCKHKMKFFPEGDDYHHELDICRDLVGSESGTISNSCDGLICVVGNGFTYLVNPSIQRLKALPKRSRHFNMPDILSTGLGSNDSTGEYKVVQLFHHKVGQHMELGCEAYTVGNLHSLSCWKVINSPPLEPSPLFLPVFVNGTIHWTVRDAPGEVSPEIALSFDVKSEKFDVILHPEGRSRPPWSRVAELEGLLCLASTHCDRVRMDIWVLKDYDNREWMRQYCIDLSAMHDYMKCLAFSIMPVTVHDGKVVFSNDQGCRDYYDPQSKSFVKHVLVPTDFGEDTAYTESIVWPVEG